MTAASASIVDPSAIKIGFGWDLRRPTAVFDIDVGVFAYRADGQPASADASISFWETAACDGALRLNEGGYLADDDVSLCINACRIPGEVQSYEIVWRIRDAYIRNQRFNMIKNAYLRIADRRFRWDALDHPINTEAMTSPMLLVARLMKSDTGWSLIKEAQQLF